MLVGFPEPLITRLTPRTGPWQAVRHRLRRAFCRILDGVGVPGAIRPASIADPLTGQQIEVAVSPGFVRLSVDGRDYFFDRLNGRLTSGAGP